MWIRLPTPVITSMYTLLRWSNSSAKLIWKLPTDIQVNAVLLIAWLLCMSRW